MPLHTLEAQELIKSLIAHSCKLGLKLTTTSSSKNKNYYK